MNGGFPKLIMLIFLPVFSNRVYGFLLSRATVHQVERNNQTFQGLLDTGSKLTVISEDLYDWGIPIRADAYGGQMSNGVLVQVCLIVAQWIPETCFGYFFSSRMHNWNRLLNSWQNLHIHFLTCRVRVIMIQKAN